jgi:hypothetical protein
MVTTNTNNNYFRKIRTAQPNLWSLSSCWYGDGGLGVNEKEFRTWLCCPFWCELGGQQALMGWNKIMSMKGLHNQLGT